jgi:hypothetical protein
MGWKWKDALKGAFNGAKAGSAGGPEGALIGAAVGGGVGGFNKDLDKRFTGDSQSGTMEGIQSMAGNLGSGMNGGKSDTGSMMNMFSRGTSTKSSSRGSGLDISKLLSSVSGSGQEGQGGGTGIDPMAILGGKKKDDQQTNIDAILKMIMAQQNQPSMNFQPNAYSSPRLEMASNRGY